MLRKSTPKWQSIDALAANIHLATTKDADDALWTIYVSEAEKSRLIVEGWKHDMDGLLVFVSISRCPYDSLDH
jgi:hypothetical protein